MPRPTPGFTPTDAGHHSRINYAGYVDFSGKPIDKLYVDIAGRYEHYKRLRQRHGRQDHRARYDFSSAYAVRGTFSNGFRAPTLAEEYYSSTNVGPSTAFVQLPPNSAGAGFLGLGNGLQPEKSTSFSLGFVFRPTEKLTGTVDFYQTIIRNRIVGTGSLYGTVNGIATPNATAINDAIAANGNQLDPAVVQNGTTGVNIFTNGVGTMHPRRRISCSTSRSTATLDHMSYGPRGLFDRRHVQHHLDPDSIGDKSSPSFGRSSRCSMGPPSISDLTSGGVLPVRQSTSARTVDPINKFSVNLG